MATINDLKAKLIQEDKLMSIERINEMRVCHKSVTHPFFVCVSIYSS